MEMDKESIKYFEEAVDYLKSVMSEGENNPKRTVALIMMLKMMDKARESNDIKRLYALYGIFSGTFTAMLVEDGYDGESVDDPEITEQYGVIVNEFDKIGIPLI